MFINTHTLFVEVYNATSLVVPFDPEWANGTGYFDGAVSAPLEGPEGTVYKTVDESGRRIVLVKGERGNDVVFERYADNEEVDYVPVCGNVSSKTGILVPGTRAGCCFGNTTQLLMVIGDGSPLHRPLLRNLQVVRERAA